MKKNKSEEQPDIHATIPFPDHSDMRGFSYRAPQVVNEPETDAKSMEMAHAANKHAQKAGATSEASAEQDDDESEDYSNLPTSELRTPEMDFSPGTEAEDDEDIQAEAANDDEDVLEKVRGGLRADTPDDNEYDDSTAHSAKVARDQKTA